MADLPSAKDHAKVVDYPSGAPASGGASFRAVLAAYQEVQRRLEAEYQHLTQLAKMLGAPVPPPVRMALDTANATSPVFHQLAAQAVALAGITNNLAAAIEQIRETLK
jgi:hypothetical protein